MVGIFDEVFAFPTRLSLRTGQGLAQGRGQTQNYQNAILNSILTPYSVSATVPTEPG